MKKITFLLLLTSFSLFSQLQINEVDADTPSIDDQEFIELKSTTPNFSLDGYVLVLFNGNGDYSYYALDLDGYTTDANGIITIGSSGVSPFPGILISANVIQNGADAVAIYEGDWYDFPEDTPATTTNLIDALVYDTNDSDDTGLMEALGVTTQTNEASGSGGSTANSVQLMNNGTYVSAAPTPGVPNDGSGVQFVGITATLSNSEMNEGDSFTVTFTTTGNVSEELQFEVSFDNEGFTADDFTGSTTITITSGTNSVTETYEIVDDEEDEGDEVFVLNMTAIPYGYNLLNNLLEGVVVDDDYGVSDWGTPLNPTYTMVSSTAPAGYYSSLDGLSGDALKQAIQDIIADPEVVHAHNYGDVTDILKEADQNPLNNNEVWLIYTEQPRAKIDFQTTSNNVGTWNREHIYPQSRGGFSGGTEYEADGIDVYLSTNADDILAGHADAHHIRAVDGPENSSRGNQDYGPGAYEGPTGNSGSWKGDVARALFYMAIRYNDLDVVEGNPADTTVGEMGDLETLLDWNVDDPADDFEMHRNNYIYTWQQNRNPFIDYPELADYIWGDNAGEVWNQPMAIASEEVTVLEVYPNPTQQKVFVKGLQDAATIKIYNQTGQQVAIHKISSANNSVNLPETQGIYFLQIVSDGQIYQKKILKL